MQSTAFPNKQGVLPTLWRTIHEPYMSNNKVKKRIHKIIKPKWQGEKKLRELKLSLISKMTTKSLKMAIAIDPIDS